jgi:hypothetical protein
MVQPELPTKFGAIDHFEDIKRSLRQIEVNETLGDGFKDEQTIPKE